MNEHQCQPLEKKNLPRNSVNVGKYFLFPKKKIKRNKNEINKKKNWVKPGSSDRSTVFCLFVCFVLFCFVLFFGGGFFCCRRLFFSFSFQEGKAAYIFFFFFFFFLFFFFFVFFFKIERHLLCAK